MSQLDSYDLFQFARLNAHRFERLPDYVNVLKEARFQLNEVKLQINLVEKGNKFRQMIQAFETSYAREEYLEASEVVKAMVYAKELSDKLLDLRSREEHLAETVKATEMWLRETLEYFPGFWITAGDDLVKYEKTSGQILIKPVQSFRQLHTNQWVPPEDPFAEGEDS